VKEAAVGLHNAIKGREVGVGTAPAWWNLTDSQFRDWYDQSVEGKPNATKFREWAVQHNAANSFREVGQSAWQAYESSYNDSTTTDYSPAQALSTPASPMRFPNAGDAFRTNPKPDDVNAQISLIDNHDRSWLYGKPLSELNDVQLREEVTKIGQAIKQRTATEAQLGRTMTTDEAVTEFAGDFHASSGAHIKELFDAGPEGPTKHLENVHKMRWLVKHRGGAPAAPSGGGGGVGFTPPTPPPDNTGGTGGTGPDPVTPAPADVVPDDPRSITGAGGATGELKPLTPQQEAGKAAHPHALKAKYIEALRVDAETAANAARVATQPGGKGWYLNQRNDLLRMAQAIHSLDADEVPDMRGKIEGVLKPEGLWDDYNDRVEPKARA
jgi:hypothetical protein